MENQWFESESFWNNYGPIMFDESRWAEASEVAKKICQIAKIKKGQSVLDAGCGPGRISVELALLGMDVTGVDIIQSELDAAKESADCENIHLTLIKADLREFCCIKKFDCAVNLYTSFGYCKTIEEDFKIIQNIFNSLKDDGTFILECVSRETAILYFTEGEWFERTGKTVLTEFSVQGAWEGLISRWILIDNKTGKRMEHTFVQRLYSAVELKKMFLQAGFKTVEIYGGFDNSNYDQNAKTMVLVGKKTV